MKIFHYVLLSVMALLSASGCGHSSKIANDPYSGEGYGESIVSKDIAREKAFNSAVSEITRKYNIVITEESQQLYSSSDSTKGVSNEHLSFNSSTKARSEARLNDVIIKNERIRKVGKKWTCQIRVELSPINIE